MTRAGVSCPDEASSHQKWIDLVNVIIRVTRNNDKRVPVTTSSSHVTRKVSLSRYCYLENDVPLVVDLNVSPDECGRFPGPKHLGVVF